MSWNRDSRNKLLGEVVGSRIMILDGAMGTMIQRHDLSEKDFRGPRFADFHIDVKGNNDLLSLTQADIIRDIHAAYLQAGSDIVGTNTFSSTSIAQADYDMQDLAYELNVESARLAREACDAMEAETPTDRVMLPVLGPHQSHGFDFSGCERPGCAQCNL